MNLLKFPGLLLALFRAIVCFGSILLVLILYVITIPIFGHNQVRAFNLRRNWLKFGQRLLGIKVEYKGKPINTAALYVSNHRTLSDPIATCRVLDAFVIAKAEVADIPILNQGAKLTGVMYVKRDSKESRSSVRETTTEVLKSGQNVLVYPEGTTSGEVMPLPYRYGTFTEAIKHNIPIVPIAIEYKHQKDMWRQGKLIPQFFRQFSHLNTHILHIIGEPIEAESGEEAAQIARQWTYDMVDGYIID